MPASAVHVYFSGAEGFHVLIDTRAAGRIRPASDLHRVFVRVRLAILEEMPRKARSLLDLAIADKMRLLRLPNTRHSGSGLFKIALTASELHSACAAVVLDLARTPRPLHRVASAGLVPIEMVDAAPRLVERFERARAALRCEQRPHPYRLPTPPAFPENLCPRQLALWRADVPRGNRNDAAIREGKPPRP